MAPNDPQLSDRLSALAADLDREPRWPHESIELLREAGFFRRVLPESFGGDGAAYADVLRGYETVARGCVSTALLLTQRDGACDLVLRGDNERLRRRLLPGHAAGRRFASIGISQLTTSTGAGRSKMTAAADGDSFVLDGVMPWVSGACRCDEIVTGAVLDDGRQLLACVPASLPGVTVEPPMKLLALEASCTSRVRCEGARIGPEMIVRGPAERVLNMRSPVKGFTVSAVGVGLASAIQKRLNDLAESRAAELRPAAHTLGERLNAVRARLYTAVEAAAKRRRRAARPGDASWGQPPCPRFEPSNAGRDTRSTGSLPSSADASAGTADDESPSGVIRIEINALLTQLASALLTASKGGGFVRGQPAERLLREAMFFHVWSAPEEIRAATIARLIGADR